MVEAVQPRARLEGASRKLKWLWGRSPLSSAEAVLSRGLLEVGEGCERRWIDIADDVRLSDETIEGKLLR